MVDMLIVICTICICSEIYIIIIIKKYRAMKRINENTDETEVERILIEGNEALEKE